MDGFDCVFSDTRYVPREFRYSPPLNKAKESKGQDPSTSIRPGTPPTAPCLNLDINVSDHNGIHPITLPSGKSERDATITFTGVKLDTAKKTNYWIVDDYGYHSVVGNYDRDKGTLSVTLPKLQGRKVEKDGSVIIRLQVQEEKAKQRDWSRAGHLPSRADHWEGVGPEREFTIAVRKQP